MAPTAYAPCPCGSGKKLKFCCHQIADEVERAIRLMEGNQPHVADQQLEQLSRKHPQNPWIVTTRAMILHETGELVAARDLLRGLLEVNPDHELAIVLYASTSLLTDGPEVARRAIHRAYQRSARKYPDLVAGIAASRALLLVEQRKVLAARQHVTLALRLATEERRQDFFVTLLELDSDERISYPLRGPHALPAITAPTEDLQKEIRKAQKYSSIGCWSTAADLFQTLTQSIPDSAELWHSVGLCRAWDGDEVQAAQALHRAAQLYTDRGVAVECETLAQQIEQPTAADPIEIGSEAGKVSSVAQLLTLLDQCPSIDRSRSAANQPELAAELVVLDRPKWSARDYAERPLEGAPRAIGSLSIYSANPETGEPASAYLTGDKGERLDAARALLSSVAGELITWEESAVVGTVPRDLQPLRGLFVVPNDATGAVRRSIRQTLMERQVFESWVQTPLRILGGRTPRDAATDPAWQLPVAAAVYVIDAYCLQQGYSLDVGRVFATLQLEPLPPLQIDDSTQVNLLSVMQTHRLPLEQLSDETLGQVVNRALLSNHIQFLYRVLGLALRRPSCEPHLDVKRCLQSMIQVCVAIGRRDEAFEWLQIARTKPHSEKSDVEYLWTWFATIRRRMCGCWRRPPTW